MFVVILELRRKLGESKADQERRLQERLKRRQELIQQREEKGLNCGRSYIRCYTRSRRGSKVKRREKEKKGMSNLYIKFVINTLDMWPSTKDQEDSWILGNRKVLEQ